MDGQRFDDLARRIARSSSRRSVLRTAAGGAGAGLLALLGIPGASADNTCKPANSPQSKCNKDAQCCVGLVCGPGGLCQPGCRINETFFVEGAEEPTNVCRTCQPMASTVSWSNVDGVTCETGNLCKTGEQCLTGVCGGGTDVVCGTDSVCATYGCNPATGCFTDYVAAETTCAPSTCQSDALILSLCDGAGACVTRAPVPCDPYICNAAGTACRSSCGSDIDCQGDAYCQDGVCVANRAQGAACQRNEQCLSNQCVDGVCCAQTSCDPCQACNIAGLLGTCATAVGIPGDACYTSGTCAPDGSCTPTIAKVCPEQECNSVVCQNGECQYTPTDFGSPCGTGGTECSPTICQNGSCQEAPDTATGDTCGGGAGLCYGGSCCNGLTTGSGPCMIGYGACCQTGSCCGGACCDQGCWFEESDGEFCCGTNSSTPCGSTCCFDGRVCYEGGAVPQCVFREQICDNNVLCQDQCCVHSGGQKTCCASGQICSVNGCAAAGRTCMTDGDCIAGESCVGGTYRPTEEGPVRETAGVCCYGTHICPTGEGGMGDGEAYFCCGSGGYCCAEGGCADFPDYRCTRCTCSFRIIRPY